MGTLYIYCGPELSIYDTKDESQSRVMTQSLYEKEPITETQYSYIAVGA